LKLLALLGAGDRGASENMYAVVQQVLRRAPSNHTIGNAIIAECVATITTMFPNPHLLTAGKLVWRVRVGLRCCPQHNTRWSGRETHTHTSKLSNWPLTEVCRCLIQTALHCYATNLDVLIAAAAEAVATFLKAPSHNLRYVGIDALAGIIRINPQAAQVWMRGVLHPLASCRGACVRACACGGLCVADVPSQQVCCCM
jgi:hypothetical protein